jgi:N-acetyl-anhydromuramyl-L-alanine amidase AmpD
LEDSRVTETYYPSAIVERLLNHSAPGTLKQRDLIVLHITAGSTARSAIETFKASAPPKRVSAHCVIDRDGAVYQLLPFEETAWHASEVNSRSIGIEHAAIPQILMATEEQYAASAKLVAWLCKAMGIPCDRAHIQPHSQASPVDGHALCCQGALDPDRVAAMAAEIVLPMEVA